MTESDSHTYTVIFLIFLLVILIVLLIYFYKKLNRDTDGKYTIHELIYGQDGARQRLQNGVQTLENFLGIRLWPRKREEAEGEDEEEHQEERVEVPDIEQDQEHDTKSLEDQMAEEEDSSDDYSSMEGVDLRDKAKLMKENKEEGEKEEEEGGVGGAGSGVGSGLLVDLKQFSGSAIWQEEKIEVKVDGCDLTAL